MGEPGLQDAWNQFLVWADDFYGIVAHFLPHSLKSYGFSEIDGIWNLVLACKECNRGTEGKSNKVPELSYLYALNNRNNYYIESHHPLKETIKNQTGKTREEREHFLQTQYNRAIETIPVRWGPLED